MALQNIEDREINAVSVEHSSSNPKTGTKKSDFHLLAALDK